LKMVRRHHFKSLLMVLVIFCHYHCYHIYT
jgi:hypothetical protein